VSITQVRNFVETHLLGFALNQSDSKQRNKIFIFFFESPIMETELNIEKKFFKEKENPILELHRFLVLYNNNNY
jgi:hypothetical protein